MEKHLVIGYCDRTIRVFVSLINEDSDGRFFGRFVLKNVFNTVEQIQTIYSKRLLTKDYELIVSQPGGNLLRFNPNDEISKERFFHSIDNLRQMMNFSFQIEFKQVMFLIKVPPDGRKRSQLIDSLRIMFMQLFVRVIHRLSIVKLHALFS